MQRRTKEEDLLELQLTATVERSQSSLRAAKAALRSVLAQWRIDDRTANAVYDVVHELLANALLHAAPPVQLSVRAGRERVRVDVSDGSPSPARVLAYRPGISERGLGLRLVQQLSAEWGQQVRDGGKTVWAVFQRRPASPEPHGRTGVSGGRAPPAPR